MNITVFDEEVFYSDIFSRYSEVAGDKKAVFLWKAKELRELMKLLEEEDNREIVAHAIVFILSLGTEEKLRGINATFLNDSAQKEFRKILQSELSEKLPN